MSEKIIDLNKYRNSKKARTGSADANSPSGAEDAGRAADAHPADTSASIHSIETFKDADSAIDTLTADLSAFLRTPVHTLETYSDTQLDTMLAQIQKLREAVPVSGFFSKRREQLKAIWVRADELTRAYGAVLDLQATPSKPGAFHWLSRLTGSLPDGQRGETFYVRCRRVNEALTGLRNDIAEALEQIRYF